MLSDAEIELLTKQETSLEDHQAIMKIDCQKLLNRLKNQSGRMVIATKEDEKTLKHYAKLSRRQAIILGLTNINHYYHRQKYHCKNISQAYHLSEIVLDQETIYELWEIYEKSGSIPIYPWENQEKVNQLAYFKLAESAVQVKRCLYTILEDLQYELFLNQPSSILDRLASFVAPQQDPQPLLANIERLKHVLSRCQDIAELSVFLLREDLDHEFKKCQMAHYEESNPAIRDYLKNVCTLLEDLRQDPTLRRAKPIDIFDQPKYRQHLNNWHSYAQQQGKPLLTTLLYLYLFLQAKDPQDRVRVRQRQHEVMGNFFRTLLTQQELCHYYRRQTRNSRNAITYRSACVINGERHDWDAKTHSYRQRHYP